MNIRELHRTVNEHYYADVSLSYKECRDIANLIFEYIEILKENNPQKAEKYKEIRHDTGLLFTILKHGWVYDYNFKSAEEELDDAQPVVRCRDCKYHKYGHCQRLTFNGNYEDFKVEVKDNDFCSYGSVD